MQIKLRTNKYQLLRYAGYSQEKKRPMTSVIGSFDKYARSIPADLAAKLNEEELEQLQKFLGKLKEEEAKSSAVYRIKSLADILQKCHDDLEAGIEVPDADKVFEAMRSLGRLMVKKGYKRPKISKPTPKDDRQLAL